MLFVIMSWVKQYLSIHYKIDNAIKSNMMQEIINVGHGDKKDESWWYKMNVEELEKAITTIIWMAKLYIVVNFSQYYVEYMPYRLAVSKSFIREEGLVEYLELIKNGDAIFLKIICNQF
eukprot:Gb_21727 [translate_table: standard]